MTKGNTAIICLSPHGGGMEMDAIRLTRMLSEDVNVVLVAKANHYIDLQFDQQLSGSRVLLELIQFRAMFSPAIILNMRRIITEYNIRNIVYFGASELRSLYFAFRGFDLNIIVRHGTTKTRPKTDWFHRMIYSVVNYHVVICRHLAENVEYIIPMESSDQIKLIYPSLRYIPQLDLNGNRNNIIRLLHVGRVADGKGQLEAIEACDILYDQQYKFELVCVGEVDPAYAEKINLFIGTKPYASSIKLTGYTNDVASYYRCSHIFLFPSKGEGLSNSFIEALSYGLVCVSYNNTSFPELRELGFVFYMAEDQDMDDLKVKLLEAVKKAESTHLPMKLQSDLAREIFSSHREKHEYLSLLQ